VTERPPKPSPPFPVRNLMRSVWSSRTRWSPTRTATSASQRPILRAAVHGWCEGHIEGEDSCPGCDHRGDVGRGIFRKNWLGDALRGQLPDDGSW